MIFNFGKSKKKKAREPEDQEIDLVSFQGPLNGNEVNLADNARIAEAGLVSAKELVTDALARRATTVRVEPKADRASVTFLIDGVGYSGGQLSKAQALAVTQMMKLLAGLDPKIRRNPQTGGIRSEFQGAKYTVQVETSPMTIGGERLTLRPVNLKELPSTPDALGFDADMIAKIRETASTHKGLIAACGPPRSGTSSTAYGIAVSIDAYTNSVYTLTTPGFREFKYITSFEVREDDTFEDTVRRLIRSEGEVVFIEPLKDAETVRTVMKMQSEISVISEFVAADTSAGVLKLIEWVGDPQIVADGLKMLVSQKLIRLLCDKCKEAYRPNPKVLQRLSLPEDTKMLYRAPKPPTQEEKEYDIDVCRKCNGVGYLGQAGLFEVLEVTEGMREVIAKGPTVAQIRNQAKIDKLHTFQADGVRLIGEGRTSLEEMQRIFKS